MTNTRKKISSSIQTLQSSSAPIFFNPLLGVWICEETLLVVFDILRNTQDELYNLIVFIGKLKFCKRFIEPLINFRCRMKSLKG